MSDKPNKQPRSLNRLSVVESVHYMNGSEEPITTHSAFSRWLGSDEQPFIRRMTLGSEWKRLETGWLESCGMMIITNTEKLGTQTQPDMEEIRNFKSRLVELRFSESNPGTDCIILPGESMRFHPVDIKNIYLKAKVDTVRCTVTILPD